MHNFFVFEKFYPNDIFYLKIFLHKYAKFLRYMDGICIYMVMQFVFYILLKKWYDKYYIMKEDFMNVLSNIVNYGDSRGEEAYFKRQNNYIEKETY